MIPLAYSMPRRRPSDGGKRDAAEPDGGRREPTMTLSGWRHFVDAPPASFDLKAEAGGGGLGDAARGAYDDARISYHSEMVVVATSLGPRSHPPGPAADHGEPAGDRRPPQADRLRAADDREEHRPQAAGPHPRAAARERHPGSGRIPVVYVTTPPKGSPRKLARSSPASWACPRSSRLEHHRYRRRRLRDPHRAGIELVLVDEIHNLNLATTTGEDMSDHLKYFTEHLPATFVYAGIDVNPRAVTGSAASRSSDAVS